MLELVWHPDRTANGPRERAWVDNVSGKVIGEVVVYLTGHWYVHVYHRGYQASGKEKNETIAKRRAVLVYQAMTVEVT